MEAVIKKAVLPEGGTETDTDAPVKEKERPERANYDVKPVASNGNPVLVNIKEGNLENWESRQLPQYLANVWDGDAVHRLPRLFNSSGIWVELKTVFALAAPTSLANVLWYSRVLVSTVYLGHLGKTDLAGGGLAMGIINVTGYFIIIGMAAGVDPILAQAYGARNYKLLQLTLQRAILILECACALIIVSIWLNMERILILLGQDPEIAAVASNYVLVSIPDLLVYGCMVPMRTYLRSQCITIPLSVCAGISLVIHIPLNYLFITKAGLGYRGAALSTVCTDFCFACMLVITIWLITPKDGPGKWSGWSWECTKGWGPILRLALPACIGFSVEWWTFEVFTIFAGLLPDPGTTVATMSILLNCAYIFTMIPVGISVSASTRVGIELGANNPSAAHLAAYVAWSIGLVFGVLGILTFSLLRYHVAWLFTDIVSVQLLIAKVAPLVGIVQAFSSPLNVGAGILRGCARPDILLRVTFVAFYVIGLPMSICLGFLWHKGVSGLWCGLSVGEACALAAIATSIVLCDWEAEAERAQLLVKQSRGHTVIPPDDHRNKDAVGTLKTDSSKSCHHKSTSIDHDHDNFNHSLTIPLLNEREEEESVCQNG